MPKRTINWAALDDALLLNERVLTHQQLRELGLSTSAICRWIGPRGRWQRLLPGVVLAHRGTPTRRERQLGGLRFAGADAVITGLDALRRPGLELPGLDQHLHVLVPATRQRKSFGYVRVERTRRLPVAQLRDGIPCAPVARAAVDACRVLVDLNDVRRLIADLVQRRLCPPAVLAEELQVGARQRTALPRLVLAEIAAGVRSVSEAQAREVMIRTGIPSPLWNPQLRLPDGTPLCRPDAYWPQWAAALEIDSVAWHIDPDSYRRTKRRERLMTAHGILVIAFTPAEILDDPDGFVAQLREFLRTAARRRVPDGILVTAEGAA